MSWVPSDVYAVHWDGSTGEIEYNDGKENLTISELGIYAQAEITFNNELKIEQDRMKAIDDAQDWDAYFRERRNSKLLECDWTQGNDSPLSSSKKTEWATYRQSLRNLPSTKDEATRKAMAKDNTHSGWPTKPS